MPGGGRPPPPPAGTARTRRRREALFAPYRSLGVVSSGLPLAVRRAGAATFATAAVGKAWVVYDCAKLKTAVVGPLLPHTITALATSGDVTLAVAGRAIHAHRRVHAVGTRRPPAGWGRPRHPLVVGDALLALARRRRRGQGGDRARTAGEGGEEADEWALLVWAVDGGRGDRGPSSAHPLPPGFVPTALAHPPTYVDKVLVGGADGSTALWNFVAGVCLHTSTAGAAAAAAAGVRGGAAAGPARPAVRVLAPAPALDVVALGFSNGAVALVDVRADAVLSVLADAAGTGGAGAGPVGAAPGAPPRPPPGGAVSSLSFCTAPGLPPLLAVGGSAGCLALWDCEAGRLAGLAPAAHAAGAPVSTLHWFAGEPRLLSGGADNALRQWVLSPGAAAATAAAAAAGVAPLTLLRARAGHAAPPALVRWYGPDGSRLLAAGGGPRDRSLRLVSAIQDAQSRELSQGRLGAQARRLRVEEADLKLPRIVALDACPTRERDWANVLTAHAGEPAARTWTVRDGAATGRALLPPPRPGVPPRTAPATAVAVTACGNYALVGSAAGHVDRYNMQSGLYRGGCTRPGVVAPGDGRPSSPAAPAPAPAPAAPRPRARRAHDGAVTGLSPDAPGRRAVSVGLDGWLRLWDLRTGRPLAEVGLGAPAGRLAAHAGGALVAVALEPAEAGGGGGGDAAAAAAGVRVYDIGAPGSADAPRLVRRFFTAASPPLRATDLAFSADGRWLLAAGMDGCVRVADVPAGAVRQAVRLGGPVVSLALSPGGDVLATAHAGRRGISLWSNQALFGSAGAAPPAGEGAPPVRVRPPALVSADGGVLGEQEGGEQGGGRRRPGVAFAGGGQRPVGADGGGREGARGLPRGRAPSPDEEEEEGEGEGDDSDGAGARSDASSSLSDSGGDGLDLAAGFESSDDGFASDDGGEDGGGDADWMEVEVVGGSAGADPAAPAAATAADGAPAPLAPSLITTSLLPRAQWRSLAHLDDLRARNKPVAAPAKPADAPFFLPTVPTLAGQPTFEVGGGGGDDAVTAPTAKKPRQAASPGGLAALLRRCAASPDPPAGTPPPGKWAPVAAWLRAAPPSAVDRELAALALEGRGGDEDDGGGTADGAAPADLDALLAFVRAKVEAGTDWELVQAFLGAALRAHGPAIASHAGLRAAAAGLAASLRARWERVDDLANAVLAGAAFVGGLPA